MPRLTRTVATVVVVAAFGLAGCGAGGDPVSVTLAELVEEQHRYDGEVVVTEGLVRTYDSPRHYWIEDHDLNRVELVPEEDIAPHVGDRVRVTGRFSFRDDEGLRITLDDLEVIAEATRAVGP